MLVQKSPNRWSCLLTAFAIVLDKPYEDIIKFLGHDGSEILWPDLAEPFKRRAFHPQELIDYSLTTGYTVTQIELQYSSYPYENSTPHIIKDIKRFNYYLNTFTNCVLCGITREGRPHAVAWNGLDIIDPNGTTYLRIEEENLRVKYNFHAELCFVIHPL